MVTAGIAVVLLFCVFLFGSNVSSSEGMDGNETKSYKCANDTIQNTEACLKTTLLKDYDRTLRPVPHHLNRITVYMSLFPTRIHISYGWMYIFCWTEKKWVDELLKWDPREYKNLKELTLESHLIWHPDITPLPFKGIDTGRTSFSTATVYPNGSVYAVESVSYYLPCKGNYTRWPYESFECLLTMQSQAYPSSVLDIIMMDHKDPELKYFIPDKDWNLESMSSARITTEKLEANYQVVNLEFKFILKKKAAMLATVLVFPAFVFLVTQLTFFYLDKESSARLILCSVAVTGHSIFLNYGMKVIPDETPTIPYIVFFYKYSLLISTSVLLWTIAVRSICSLVKFPYWLYKVILKIHNNRFLTCLLPFETNLINVSQGSDDVTVPIAQTESENQQWRNIAQFLDRIIFIGCFILYVILYVIYVPI